MNTNNNNWNHMNILRSQVYDYYNNDRNNLNHLRSNSLTGYDNTNGILNSSASDTYHYSSVMDVDKSGHDVKKFSWNSPPTNASHRNPSNHHVIRKGQNKNTSTNSRPFETSFKTAISKMKESSLNHLGSVEKTNEPGRSSINSASDSFYFDRDFQQKPNSQNRPQMTNGNSTDQNTKISGSSGVRIFRCNSVSNNMNAPPSAHHSKRQEPLSSVSSAYNMPTGEYTYEAPPIPNRYRHRSGNETESNRVKWSHKVQTNSLDRNKTSGSKILIPIKGNRNAHQQQAIRQSNVKQSYAANYKSGHQPSQNNNEAVISSTNVKQVHSGYPKTIIHQHSHSLDGDDATSDPNTDPLPSVQEIIAKVEALNVESPLKTPTNIKTPQQQNKDAFQIFATSAQLQKVNQNPYKGTSPTTSGSNSYYNSSLTNNASYQARQSNSFPRSGNLTQIQTKKQDRLFQPTTGSYSKTSNSPVKSKTISNFPVDFQKLHSAFLDQKNEIIRLKKELEEKKQIIADLQIHLKTYEPWR